MSAPHSTGIGAFRKQWFNPSCWALGLCRNGAENVFDDNSFKGNENGSLLGAIDETASAPFGTLDAEITQETIDFFVSDAEGDPDCPSEGYSPIEQALNSLRQGKVSICHCRYLALSFWQLNNERDAK